MKKKRIYLNTKRMTYINREEAQQLKLSDVRESIEEFEKTHATSPKEMEIGFDLYNDLCEVAKKNTLNEDKPVYLQTLFGVKIFIDPSLKPYEIKFRNK